MTEGLVDGVLRDPYRTVLEVGAALTRTLDLEQVLATVAQRIGEALDVQYCDIHDLDTDARTLTCVAVWTPVPDPEEQAYIGTVVAVDERMGMDGMLGQRCVLEEYVEDPSLDEDERALMRKWEELASLEVPLVYGDAVIGVLCVAEHERLQRRFSDDEKRLFELLAAPAAIAIRNARVYRARTERARRLAAVLDASRAISATMDLDEVLSRVAHQAVDVVEASQSAIYEYELETDSIVYRSVYERIAAPDAEPDDELGTAYPLDEYPGERSMLEKGTIVTELCSDPDLPVDRRASMAAWGEKTVLSVPLHFRGDPIGILRLYDMVDERHFDATEIELLGSLGELAAAALHNARLLRRQEQQRVRLEGLLDTSRTLCSTFDLSAVIAAIEGGVIAVFGAAVASGIWLRTDAGSLAPADVAVAEAESAEADVREAASGPPALALEAIEGMRPAQLVSGDGSSLAVPFVSKNQIEGLVAIALPGYRAFLDAEVEAVQVLANQAAVTVANARLYRKVQRLAVRDGLTGLYNHRHFQERLAAECLRAERFDLPLSLLMLDVDDFKRFNDEHGHQLGDELLREVGRILASSVRKGIDFPARYGGEEFAVILPHTPASGAECLGQRLRDRLAAAVDEAAWRDDAAEEIPPPGAGAVTVGERLREAIETQTFAGHGGRRYAHITVSIGIASSEEGGRAADQLVQRADRALYVAKQNGKNRVEVDDSEAD